MSQPRSQLLDLLQQRSAQTTAVSATTDFVSADDEPFPFLAIVGQQEMKLALLLALINPNVGGVLLVGPRGTGKTTAVRGLVDLLPQVTRSLCAYGCTEAMLEAGGMDALCPECAQKVGYGEPLTTLDNVRMFELPLNARLEDVVGGINERLALEQQRLRLERGILGHANGHILYIDEVNLLEGTVTDAILDAAAQGHYTVWRGALKLRYASRFTLIGSMNPAEGQLRPQLMDRFGLRALVPGLTDPALRFQAYEHAALYRQEPEALAAAYAEQTLALAAEIQAARQRLPQVTLAEAARQHGLGLIQQLSIASNRAEMTLFEAARAHAAADGREVAEVADINAVALLALRQRRSDQLTAFFTQQQREDEEISVISNR